MKSNVVMSRWRYLRVPVLTLVACLLISLPSSGQIQTTSGIAGNIKDPSGGAIAGAKVVVREQNTGAVHEMISNSLGYYSFPSLLPGIYTITVEMSGFQTAVVTDRQIQASQPAEVDVTLKLGKTSQTVTVSAAGAELLKTSSQSISDSITPELVRSLPTVRGNFFDILDLAPGVVSQQTNGYNAGLSVSQTSNAYNYVNIGNTYNSSGAFVGGNRDSASNVSVDGANVQSSVYQDSPQWQSTDTIKEMQVQTAGMNAEFGYGASGINIITKSGTNQVHGDVYEFLRNNMFDANSFFSNQAGRPLPNYQQNQFGVSVGGPIKKDKLLFFFNYEGLRARQGVNQLLDVPPETYRNGDFSINANSSPQNPQAPIPVYNPYQFNPVTGLRQQFPGNIIPMGATNLCAPHPTCVDPATVKFLNQWVLQPNEVIYTSTGGTPVAAGVARSSINANQYTGRIDFLQSDKSTIYARYTQTPETGISGSIEPLAATSNNLASYNAITHWTWTPKPSVVNDLFVAYTRPKWFLGRPTNIPNISTQLGLTNVSPLPGGPDFSGTGYSMDATQVFIDNATTDTYQFEDDLAMVAGRHNIKAGFAFLDKRFYYHTVADDKGVFYFNGQYSTVCPLGNATCAAASSAAGLLQGGLGFADYLMGATDENFVQLNPAPYAGYQGYYAPYIQDSWRVTTNLTLNYGLRYEYWSPWLVPRNTTLSYDPATGDPVYALQNPLDYLSSSACYGTCGARTNLPRAGYSASTHNFSPRAGLAYMISHNTVIRASGGIYYDGNRNDNQLSNLQTGGPPFTLRLQQTILPVDTPVPTYTVSTQFPSVAPTGIPQPNSTPPTTYRFVLPYLPTPVVYQWSFDVQHRLGKTWGLELSYLGSHTIHEFQYEDLNAAALPVGSLATVPLQERRPYTAWGQLQTWAPIGWARYNSLVGSFKNSSPWHGLTLQTNFMWAKDIVSSHWGYSDEGNTNFRYPYSWAGPYTAYPPFSFVAGYYYELPVGRGKAFGSQMNSAMNAILGGWVVSGITQFSDGGWAPIFNLGADTSGTGELTMPDRICNPNIVPGGRTYLHWWNPACIVPAPYGSFGNSNLAAFTVPGVNNWDLSLQKNFHTGFPRESGELQFRWEMFNVWNHTQWASPASTSPPES